MSTTTTKNTVPAAMQELLTAIRLVEANLLGRELDDYLSTAIAFVLQARDKLVAAQDEEITDQMIDDLAVAAFEGGINYWCRRAEVVGEYPEGAEFASDALAKGATVQLFILDPDDNEPESVELTSAKLREGIRLEAARVGQTIEAFYEDHDADSADNAVQMAVFGKLVYG
jgi:hypothetical protein